MHVDSFLINPGHVHNVRLINRLRLFCGIFKTGPKFMFLFAKRNKLHLEYRIQILQYLSARSRWHVHILPL